MKSLTLLNTTPLDAGLRGINGEDLKNYSEDPLATYNLEFQNIYQEEYFNKQAQIQGYLKKINDDHCKVDLGALILYIDNLFKFNFTKELEEQSLLFSL